MTEPRANKDPAPHPLKEGGVKTGREHEKKSFTDSASEAPEPTPGAGQPEEGSRPERPRDGGMLSEG